MKEMNVYMNYRMRPHYAPHSVQLKLQPGYSTDVFIEDLRVCSMCSFFIL